MAALLTDSGNVAAEYYYDAFGVITEETGTANNPFRYAGYEYDSETGLYYLKARHYDPNLARFMQEDTYRGNIKDPLSLNLYTYCNNEPVMYYDPSGHVVSATDKKNLTSSQQKAVQAATNAYNAAAAKGDKAGMAKANADANAIRASAGYSGGTDGKTITSTNPGSGVKVKDVVSSASSSWKSGSTPGTSNIGNLKEGVDYHIYNNTSYFFNNVRTIMEAAGATVNQINKKDTITIAPSPNRLPTSSELVNSILFSNKPLVSGKDFYIGWDDKAHFVDSNFGIAPVAIKPGGLKKEVNSKLIRDYLEESDIDTWLTFATGTNSNIDPVFAMRLAAYARDNETTLTITSAYRSIATQEVLYKNAGGKQDEDGNWYGVKDSVVARPGLSWHQHGQAVDVSGLRNVASSSLEEYGLHKPISGEPWHAEPLETKPVKYKDVTTKKSFYDAYNR